MHQKSRLLIIITLIFVSIFIIVLTIHSLMQNNDRICGNRYISLLGKWKHVNTARFNEIIINNTCDSNYSIEFFTNGTCKELIDCSNNTWIWKNYSTYNDYLIFGDNQPLRDGNYFKRICYEVSNKGLCLSLNHDHVMSTKNFEKVK